MNTAVSQYKSHMVIHHILKMGTLKPWKILGHLWGYIVSTALGKSIVCSRLLGDPGLKTLTYILFSFVGVWLRYNKPKDWFTWPSKCTHIITSTRHSVSVAHGSLLVSTCSQSPLYPQPFLVLFRLHVSGTIHCTYSYIWLLSFSVFLRLICTPRQFDSLLLSGPWGICMCLWCDLHTNSMKIASCPLFYTLGLWITLVMTKQIPRHGHSQSSDTDNFRRRLKLRRCHFREWGGDKASCRWLCSVHFIAAPPLPSAASNSSGFSVSAQWFSELRALLWSGYIARASCVSCQLLSSWWQDGRAVCPSPIPAGIRVGSSPVPPIEHQKTDKNPSSTASILYITLCQGWEHVILLLHHDSILIFLVTWQPALCYLPFRRMLSMVKCPRWTFRNWTLTVCLACCEFCAVLRWESPRSHCTTWCSEVWYSLELAADPAQWPLCQAWMHRAFPCFQNPWPWNTPPGNLTGRLACWSLASCSFSFLTYLLFGLRHILFLPEP